MTAALVGRNGSIDWLCWPRFDRPACFAALLGTEQNGRWLIAPTAPITAQRRAYRDGGLVLETVFETADGEVALIDFMPLETPLSSVIRIVEGRRGRADIQMELALRFDYGASVPWVTHLDDGTGICAIAGPDMAVLRASVMLEGRGMETVAAFSVAAGERVWFVLTHGASHLPLPAPMDAIQMLADTEAKWEEWSSRCTYSGPYQAAVQRSLLVLKALTYRATGGIVAAPTTSLPEDLGGTRNWDYRYCWLRDATLVLFALMNAGYYDEAQAWRDWLHRSVAGSPAQIQIMYGLAGERRLAEWEVPWLAGYQGALPVRIGNGAAGQLQLDVYGEVMNALHQARRGGLSEPSDSWSMQRAIIEHLEEVWHLPDEGIWEVRGRRRHFTFSKVMAWLAFDRVIRDADQYNLDGPIERWRGVRDAIHDQVCAEGFDAELGAFVQSYGSKELDASTLLIPIVGFLPHDDPRVRGTTEAVERGLVESGFVMRYRSQSGADGLPPGEGAFLACSFWLADNLYQQGRKDEALAMFDRLLSLRNDLGLLAEEYDPRYGRLVGNFPQAFSHVGLINTAMNLTEHTGSTATPPARQ